MPDISVKIRDKVATGDGTRIVCGNSDYTVNFDLDAEWSAYDAKTMRVYYGLGQQAQYTDVVFRGASCALPVILDCVHVAIGLYAGDLRSSTRASFQCAPSILCDAGAPSAPPDDVYAQIMELINTLQAGGITQEQISAAVAQYLADNPIVEADPTVPAWAKTPTKPEYSYGEIQDTPTVDLSGYATKQYVDEAVGGIVIPVVPTNVSAFANDAGYLTTHQDLTAYAKKQDVPDVSDFVTAADVEAMGYQTEAQVNTLIAAAINGLGRAEEGKY